MDLNSHSHDSNGAATGRKQGLPFFRHICKLSQLRMNAGYRCSVCKAAGLGALGAVCKACACKAAGLGALGSTDALGALSVAAERLLGWSLPGLQTEKLQGPAGSSPETLCDGAHRVCRAGLCLYK